MDCEEWKNFPVIDGRSFSKYEVSSLGQIRNKETGYIFTTKPKCTYVCNKFLDDDGNSNNICAHVIVARAFLGEPKTIDLTVDHINRESTDNRADNLRWATKKQQTANSDRSKCKPRGQPVIQYTMDMEEIKTWPNIVTAEMKLGIDRSSISKACKEKLKNAGGFKWVYERQGLDGEIWRESLNPLGVQVSNMGRIKPPRRHIVYGSKTTNGYLKYGKPGKCVHVMVAEAFLSNPDKKPEVNHKDKIRTNNKLENLEWVTRSEQMIHSHKTNSNPDRYSSIAKAVKQYDLEGNLIGEYRSIHQASRQTGYSVSGISRVCSGLAESTKGYVFKYSDEDVINRPSTKCSKKVDLIDKKGNVIETYESVKAAALDLEIFDKSIYNILCGFVKKTRDGHRFKYH